MGRVEALKALKESIDSGEFCVKSGDPAFSGLAKAHQLWPRKSGRLKHPVPDTGERKSPCRHSPSSRRTPK
jgi:hypothetical protein